MLLHSTVCDIGWGACSRYTSIVLQTTLCCPFMAFQTSMATWFSQCDVATGGANLAAASLGCKPQGTQ